MGSELAERLARLKTDAEQREDGLLVGIVEVLQDIFDDPAAKEGRKFARRGEKLAEEPAKVEVLSDTNEEEPPGGGGLARHLPPIPEAEEPWRQGSPAHGELGSETGVPSEPEEPRPEGHSLGPPEPKED